MLSFNCSCIRFMLQTLLLSFLYSCVRFCCERVHFFHRLWPCIRFRLRKGTLKSLLMCSFHAVRSCGFFIFLLFVCSFKVFNRCLSFLNLVMFVCPFHAVKGCGLFISFLSECSFLCPEKIRIFSYFCFIQIV